MTDEIKNNAPKRAADTVETKKGSERKGDVSRRGLLKGAALATVAVGGAAGVTAYLHKAVTDGDFSALVQKDVDAGVKAMASCKPEFLTSKVKAKLVNDYKKNYKYYKS